MTSNYNSDGIDNTDAGQMAGHVREHEAVISHGKFVSELTELISTVPDMHLDPDEDGNRAVLTWSVSSDIDEEGNGQIFLTASMPSQSRIKGHYIEDHPWRHVQMHAPKADERLLSGWVGHDFDDGNRLHCTTEIDVVEGFVRVT